MKKPVKLYYSISEVAEITQLQPYTLRSWEKEFSCLRPRRIHGKNRSYRERDIGIVLLIKRLLYDERYTTQGASQRLRSEPQLLRNLERETAFLHHGTKVTPADSSAGIHGPDGSGPVDAGPPVSEANNPSPAPSADGEQAVGEPSATRESPQGDSSASSKEALLKELIDGTRKELNELLQILR